MEVSRREVKFLIPLVHFKQLESQLKLNMDRDVHGSESGYTVRSLYFDSLFDRDYAEVIDGLEIRKKIRLRVYDPTDEKIKLEYKYKEGVNQKKTSLVLNRAQAQSMMAGDYGFLLAMSEPIAGIMYRDLMVDTYRPKVLIEYERLAYSAPGNDIRVTFDTRVRASKTNMDLFSENVNFTPLLMDDVGVLEVKYDRFLYSYLQKALHNLDSLPTAMSKYVLGRT